MPVDQSPEAIRKRAMALVQSGADGTNKHAASAAAVRACKLIKEHKLLDPPAAPAAATLKETVQAVRETIADPNAAATIAAAADFLGKASDFFKARKGG